MSRVQIRNFTAIGLIGSLIGVLFFVVGALVGAPTATDATGTHLTALGNPPVFVVGLVLALAAGIVSAIAWIFALIRTAQLQRWGWFVCMLVMGSLVTLIWSLIGPDSPAPPMNSPSS